MALTLANSDHLQQLARSNKPEDREALAKSITKLLYGDLSQGEMFLVQDILLRMLREAEAELRRTLILHFATEDKCPQALMDYLIYECPYPDAEPFLKNSTALNDTYLMEISKRYESPKYWRAIASRPKVSRDLAQFLIHTNDQEVHQILVENEGSDLCPVCMQLLTEAAANQIPLHEPLIQRREITVELAAKIYSYASAKLKEHILQRFDISEENLNKTLDYIVINRTKQKAVIRTISMEMLGLVRRMPKITTRQMIDAMQKGDNALFACMTGVYLQANPERILYDIETQPLIALAVICHAVHMNRSDFNHIYLMWRNKVKTKDSNVMSADQLTKALHVFDQLKKEQVQKVVESWRHTPAPIA